MRRVDVMHEASGVCQGKDTRRKVLVGRTEEGLTGS